MKRFLLCILAAMVPVFISGAQTPYFCDKPGTELRYVREDPGNGKDIWNHMMTITGGTPSGGSREFDCTSHFTAANGREKEMVDVEYKVLIDREGNVSSDLSAPVTSAIRHILPNVDIKAGFSPTILPSVLDPGSVLPDAGTEILIKGKPFTIKVTERKVLRFEAIETPAGKFDCVVVTEHKTEKFTMYNRDTVSYTWYARGVGMVRHDTYRKGKLQTSETLVSITEK